MVQKIIRTKIGPRGAGRLDPHQLFVNADNIRHTTETLIELPPDNRFGQSVVILAAFASELFIKCIIVLEGGSYKKEHDLDKLFSKINSITKTKMENRWNVEFAPKRASQLDAVEKKNRIKIPRDLASLLVLGKNSFEQVRYAHEQQPSGNFFLPDLPALLRTTIIEMKPEWA